MFFIYYSIILVNCEVRMFWENKANYLYNFIKVFVEKIQRIDVINKNVCYNDIKYNNI